ncbi:MAG: DUF423 domain-containing protein [Methylococcaceae bacterium]|jgi:uncharacterized membrane protein YgdD (TMEM256/DUF423 family)|nr:DUF423 domain-containing protein [Methylococcaceae bacterium]MDZ4155482.1 DUF423 domain-containing protein [Methylococcales bacterium]MDP2392167.1 DUF423 domain-containing protein [Methylococcaceae bacterium]MDP3019439.1 DUF423 domain-containing protein [Methylococcaceae bacterium]MDP3388628.1 DUF423 domain-containing protein [Methylococcaceae bacterium]
MRSVALFLGALSALTGVGMGAFGAHALKTILSPEMLAVYQTGVSYQMWHALGLIGIAIIQQLQAEDSALLNWAARLMFLGIVIFSGSLYCLTVLNQPWLGMFTPIGGVSFLTAWTLIAIFAVKKPHQSRYARARR